MNDEETVGIYGETFTMYLSMPDYVRECSIKQMRRVIKLIVCDWDDQHRTENLMKLWKSVNSELAIPTMRTRKKILKRKQELIAEAVNEYTAEIVRAEG